MKQTATDYQHEQFLKAFIDYVEEKIDGARFSELMIEARVKSQLMEKEQIKDAWLNAWKDSMLDPLQDKYYEPEAEQYYNETYKQ